jgi:phosphatidate cytidylyltransferase
MLSLRIVTAIALIIPAVISLFFLSPFWVTAYFGLFIAAGAWEWTALIGMRRRAARAAYTIGVVALGAVLIAAGARAAMIVFFGATVFWTLALVELIRRPGVHQGWLHGPVARYVVGFAVLVPPLIAVYVLHDADRYRPMLLLFALVLVWIADSAAYFAGHFFGRTKLAPAISPGKTMEGAIGGLIGVAMLAWLGSVFIWGYHGAALAGWLALATVAAAYSVLGDLLESKFKRAAGVKDSGALLPGHGGVLDRIDATTAALPVFAFGWQLSFGGI